FRSRFFSGPSHCARSDVTRAGAEVFVRPETIVELYSIPMTTVTRGSSRLEQPNVNRLLGPALKSLYDIEIHLKKSTLEAELRELVKLRVSQINRCAFCIIYHRRDALKLGVTDRKIHLLNAWQEASEYSDRERAALAWAEAVTLISAHHLPDDVYG